ncbi:MAG TPA: hypothetical protein VGD01_04705 [Candidatus Elarobacter sp.]|jgi:hypothetical protein
MRPARRSPTDVPTAEELAAIAAAYLVLTAREAPAAPREVSRWALAGRLPLNDGPRARFAARSASRWTIAGRLDG